MFKEKNTPTKNKVSVQSAFTDLTTLVCAPIQAVTQANLEANKKILDTIDALGRRKPIIGDKITILDYLGVQYKHVKNTDGQEAIEDMLLQVPLLSIVPLNSMKVKAATIDFNAEVRSIEKENQLIDFEGRICAPEVRTSDYIPKVHFKIELENEPITEGMARIQDTMDIQQMIRSIDIHPFDKTGKLVEGKEKDQLLYKRGLCKKYDKTKQLGEQVEELINHQKLYFNSLIQAEQDLKISDYEEFSAHILNDDVNFNSVQTSTELIELDKKIKLNISRRNSLRQKENDLMEQLIIFEGIDEE